MRAPALLLLLIGCSSKPSPPCETVCGRYYGDIELSAFTVCTRRNCSSDEEPSTRIRVVDLPDGGEHIYGHAGSLLNQAR